MAGILDNNGTPCIICLDWRGNSPERITEAFMLASRTDGLSVTLYKDADDLCENVYLYVEGDLETLSEFNRQACVALLPSYTSLEAATGCRHVFTR